MAVVGIVIGMIVKPRVGVLVALVASMFVALGVAPASANSGSVTATQNCQRWHVSVSLNHDTQPDRSVDVITTIPGTAGIHGGHFDTSFGEIWSAGGPAPASGTVTLNIYYANGQLEYTDSKALPAAQDCATTTTTTEAPTTTTMAPTTTTTIVTEGTTATTSTTVAVSGRTATTSTTVAATIATRGGTVAAGAANTLPRTGSSGPGPVIGLASLLIGAVMLALSRRRRLL